MGDRAEALQSDWNAHLGRPLTRGRPKMALENTGEGSTYPAVSRLRCCTFHLPAAEGGDAVHFQKSRLCSYHISQPGLLCQ